MTRALELYVLAIVTIASFTAAIVAALAALAYLARQIPDTFPEEWTETSGKTD